MLMGIKIWNCKDWQWKSLQWTLYLMFSYPSKRQTNAKFLILMTWLSACQMKTPTLTFEHHHLENKINRAVNSTLTNKISWPTHTAVLKLIQLYDEESNSVLRLFYLKNHAMFRAVDSEISELTSCSSQWTWTKWHHWV